MTPDLPNSPTSGASRIHSDAAQAAIGAADVERSPQPAKPTRSLKPWVFGSFALAGVSAVLSVLALLFAAGVLAPLGDTTDIERQVRSYLLANPEVIVESVNSMDARQQAAEENELTAVLAQRHDEVFNDPGSPVGANPRGEAILVEFFDYNCPYCRSATPILDKLQSQVRSDSTWSG